MAYLSRPHGDEQRILYSRTLVGRSPLAQLRIQDRVVSNEHAVLWFDDGVWWIKDLGSRNGTFLGDVRLQRDEPTQLVRGVPLVFGGATARWLFSDDSAPGPVAVCHADGERVTGSPDLLMIPSEEEPELAAYPDGQGGWLIEMGETVQAAKEVTDVVVAGHPWTLVLPFENARTWRGPGDAHQEVPALRFAVSSDEEHVEIELQLGSKAVALEPRTHGYFLLTLARQRLEDAQGTGAVAEHGWLHAEDLCRMLRIDRATLNQRVFRARQQLARTGLVSAAAVVERRAHTGQLRLGIPALTVGPLG